ncbi:redoxin domain-containing protein [Marinifilum sp. RC60d5]|uniref:redoxin domain-containing protein n=1 Tax=Marinifilum sp. RC60d5 TaxID=3458414 RepID=UPI0040351F63
MKTKIKLLILCIGIGFSIISCGTQEKHDGYILNGVVEGAPDGIVTMSIEDKLLDKVIFTDTTQIVEGKFTFKGKIEHPDMVILKLGKVQTSFILENSEMELSMDLNQETDYLHTSIVTGSVSNDLYMKSNAEMEAIIADEKYQPLVDNNNKLKEIDQSTKEGVQEVIKLVNEVQTTLYPLFTERNNRMTKVALSHVKNNPSSASSPWIIGGSFMGLSPEKQKEVFSSFKGDAKNTCYYRIFENTINSNANKLVVGKNILDFTLQTIDGKSLTLSEVEGKYILLDFWASWCGSCRKSMKHVKHLYENYKKDGFVVVCVTTGDTDAKWRKAVKQDGTEMWHHVFDPRSNAKRKKSGKVADLYGIKGLPTTYLIDDNMMIVGENLRGESLDKKLEELFGH